MIKLFFAAWLLPFSTSAASIYCSDIDAVAKEAVEYHLRGAISTSLPMNCLKQVKWKFFDPKIEVHSPEPRSKTEYIWFHPGKDSYKIIKTTPVKDRYKIDVEFTLNGKKIPTAYTYIPVPDLQKSKGVCGVVVNDEFNSHPEREIISFDCRK